MKEKAKARKSPKPVDKTGFPYVRKIYLLLIAGVVWLVAGANIVNIGLPDFIRGWDSNILYIVCSGIVYALFVYFIFYKLVQKHNSRILGYTNERLPFCFFFDLKSYLIMLIMMTGGLTLRASNIAPPIIIGVLYCGIGFSLMTAGVLFIQKFLLAKRFMQTSI